MLKIKTGQRGQFGLKRAYWLGPKKAHISLTKSTQTSNDSVGLKTANWSSLDSLMPKMVYSEQSSLNLKIIHPDLKWLTQT